MDWYLFKAIADGVFILSAIVGFLLIAVEISMDCERCGLDGGWQIDGYPRRLIQPTAAYNEPNTIWLCRQCYHAMAAKVREHDKRGPDSQE